MLALTHASNNAACAVIYSSGHFEALLDPRVWLTGAIYFCFVAGLYGVGFWLPTIISGMGVKSPLNVGFVTAMPYAAGAIGMVLVGNSADYHRERRWHVAIPAGLGATGLVLGGTSVRR
jgi:predicted MFS family arabinose efflux permease